MLADLGVDVIEAGFPIASPGRFRKRAIHREASSRPDHRRPGPLQPRRHRPRRRRRQRRRKATHSRLPRHERHPPRVQTRMSPEEVVKRAVEGVKRARERCEDVEFSPEDAARTELDFLAEVVERVIEAGATTLNIPDTVGYAVPTHYAAIMRHLRQKVRGIDKCVLSVHCHNDLGLAVANSLAALGEGARQVECTINGIGERAGNTALEEVVMALRTRQDFYGLTTGINTRLLVPGQPEAVADYRQSSAAQQGYCRPKRVRARSRDPPRRHAEGARALTKSCGRKTSAFGAPNWYSANTAGGTH